MKPAERIVPFYFGRPDKRLFACYHEPSLERRRKCGIVICQPIGHEYINCHRALRQLAARLCYVGFPILRFDYYGCGDSSGSAEEGRIPQWLEDVSAAISELRRRANVVQVCLMGLRVGGALAMMAAAERTDLESLVLWDPVISGRSYLHDLLRLQKEMLRFRPKPSGTQAALDYVEVLGFPLSRFLQAELKKIDLSVVAAGSIRNVLTIETHRTTDKANMQEHLSRMKGCIECEKLNAPPIWLPTPDGSLLVPTEILHSIVSWTSKVHA